MKTVMKLWVVTLMVLVFAPVNAQSTKWQVDGSHSSIKFEINHFFTPVSGTFDNFSGTLYFDPEHLSSSKADFTIQVSSINTNNEKRDKHLQSSDFFDVEKWPTIKFVSSSFEKKGDKEYVAHGKLTIKDITKDYDLPFTVLGIQEHPKKKGKLMAGLRAMSTVNRTDYGVGTGSWAATAVVGDEVSFVVTLEALADKVD